MRANAYLIWGLWLLGFWPTFVLGQTRQGLQFHLGSSFNSTTWEYTGPSSTRFYEGIPKGLLQGSVSYINSIPQSRWYWKVGFGNVPLVQQVTMGPIWESPQAFTITTARVISHGALLHADLGGYIYQRGPWSISTELGVGALYSDFRRSGILSNSINVGGGITPEERGAFEVSYGGNERPILAPHMRGAFSLEYTLPWEGRILLGVQGGVGFLPLEVSNSTLAEIESQAGLERYQFSITNRGNYGAIMLGYEMPLRRNSGEERAELANLPLSPMFSAYGRYGLTTGTTSEAGQGWRSASSPAIGLGLQLRFPLTDQWTIYTGAEWNSVTFQAESDQPDAPFQYIILHQGDIIAAQLGGIWYPWFLPASRAWNVGLYTEARVKVYQDNQHNFRSGTVNEGAFIYSTVRLPETSPSIQLQSGLEASYQFREGLFVFGRGGYSYFGTQIAAKVDYQAGAIIGETTAYITNTGWVMNLGLGFPIKKRK